MKDGTDSGELLPSPLRAWLSEAGPDGPVGGGELADEELAVHRELRLRAALAGHVQVLETIEALALPSLTDFLGRGADADPPGVA